MEKEDETGEIDMETGKKKKEELKWCDFVYELWPNFRYTCGVIGHVDKSCVVKLKKGEVQ